MNSGRAPAWGLYASLLILFAALINAVQWLQLPRSIDAYYHLSVVEGFSRAGGWVGDSFWDFAPVGRPHLYPPLLHILMLGLKRIGIPPLEIVRLFDALIGAVLAGVVWWVLTAFLTRRAAFLGLLIWVSTFSLFLSSFLYPANSLAMIFGLLALRHHARSQRAGFAASIVLSIYAHGWVGWIFLAACILDALADAIRSKLQRPGFGFWILAASAALAAAPLVAHQWAHRAAYHSAIVAEDSLLEISLLPYAAALVGLGWAIRRRDRNFLIPVFLWTASLPLATVHPWRFWCGHTMFPVVWLAAGGIDFCLQKAETRGIRVEKVHAICLGIIAFFFLVNPTWHLNLKTKTPTLQILGSTLVRGALNPSDQDPRLACIYSPAHTPIITALIDRIKAPNDILWCNLDYPGAMIASLSGLATSTAPLAEVRPSRPFNPMTAASILLWFKEVDGSAPPDLAPAVQNLGLLPQGETEMALIYRNPTGGQAVVRQAAVPEAMLWLLVLPLLGIALSGAARRPGVD